VPPFYTPGTQENPILFSEVTRGKLVRVVGASGTKTTTAPFPAGDCSESPTLFVAII